MSQPASSLNSLRIRQVTTLLQVCFAAAANRLPLGMIGILYHLAPGIAFLLALYVYNEPIDSHQTVTFGFIWLASALFLWEGGRHQRKSLPAPAGGELPSRV